jgi:hypothetical protein
MIVVTIMITIILQPFDFRVAYFQTNSFDDPVFMQRHIQRERRFSEGS